MLTRRFEHLQLDEWPIVAFVLALCLMWFSWRRYRLALTEIAARQATETKLTEALAENRALARASLLSLEAERKHLARELHDELGQYLNAIKIDAVEIEGTPSGFDQKLSRRMLTAVDHIHGVVSDMIRRLRPAGLDELGLTAAVESCIEQWQERLPRTALSFPHTRRPRRLFRGRQPHRLPTGAGSAHQQFQARQRKSHRDQSHENATP